MTFKLFNPIPWIIGFLLLAGVAGIWIAFSQQQTHRQTVSNFHVEKNFVGQDGRARRYSFTALSDTKNGKCILDIGLDIDIMGDGKWERVQNDANQQEVHDQECTPQLIKDFIARMAEELKSMIDALPNLKALLEELLLL